MWHTTFIAAHAIAGLVALTTGLVAIRNGRLFDVYLASLAAMTIFLVLAIAADWSTIEGPGRVLFTAFAALASVMVGLALQARRIRPTGPARPPSRYVHLVGFTLVALFDAFVVIAVLDAGAPSWLVVGTGVLIALAGHLTLRRARRPPRADPMTTRELNATAAALLGFLHDGPMTGWDLVATAQERIGNFWTLTQSQVYRELARMTETGLITAGDPGPRDRKPYTITKTGRKAFADWITRDPARDQIRVPLLLTIHFAAHLPPGRLQEIITTERARHAERLASYHKARKLLTGNPAETTRLATLHFGIRHEQAVLAWLDELPTLITP